MNCGYFPYFWRMTSETTVQYDYIFTGAGLAALMTAYKMVSSPAFQDQTLLLLDEDAKKTNNRTWCFWSTSPSIWDGAVAKHWDVAWFASEAFSRDLTLQPYRYQMIRGIDFYQQVLTLLQQHPKVTFVQEKVTDIEETEQQIFVKTTEAVYFGKRVLNW